jgi:hypothetical protein
MSIQPGLLMSKVMLLNLYYVAGQCLSAATEVEQRRGRWVYIRQRHSQTACSARGALMGVICPKLLKYY